MLYISPVDNSLHGDYHGLHSCAVSLLTEGIKKEYGICISESCISTGRYGKPFIPQYPNIHFSYSHCFDMAVCYISDTECGCDIEAVGRNIGERVMKRCFTEREISAVNSCGSIPKGAAALWTLKESYVKAIGTGLAYGMKKAELCMNNNRVVLADKEIADSCGFITLTDGEHIVSVCEMGRNPIVTFSSWDQILFPFSP